MPKKSLFLCLSAAIFLSGCASGPKYLAKDIQFPQEVAVLPFSNETNDVSAPETVRKHFIALLPLRGYAPLPQETADEILMRQYGITDGGQLNSVTPQALSAELKVQGLFYGNVISFVDLPLGFARKRTVKAEFKLLDTSGNLLWEDQKSWTTPELYLSSEDAKNAAIRQVAERQLEKMTNTFLQDETRMVVLSVLRNLPPLAAADENKFNATENQLSQEMRRKSNGRIKLQ